MSTTTTISTNGTGPDNDAGTGRPYWLTQPCPSWCDHLHSETDHPADRWHCAESHKVILTTDEPVVTTMPADQPRSPGDARFHADPALLTAYLRQGYRETGPRIALSYNEGPSMYLTLAEAEEISQALLNLVHTARREAGLH